MDVNLHRGYQPQRALTPAEREELARFKPAMELAVLWLTDFVDRHSKNGPYSEAYIGEPAVDYFSHRATYTYFKHSFARRKDESEFDYIKRIMRDDMGKHIKKWRKMHEPMVYKMGPMDEAEVAHMEMVAQEMEEDLAKTESHMEIALKVAEKVAEGDPMLTKYVKAMKDYNDYRSIAKRLKITQKEVEVLEERLIELVKPYAQTA
ncbi:MAG: hypothetical protein K6A67_09400 [Bacteroidales bacterium]|nr:hypothetical protein [Bacteroidales bacterium]